MLSKDITAVPQQDNRGHVGLIIVITGALWEANNWGPCGEAVTLGQRIWLQTDLVLFRQLETLLESALQSVTQFVLALPVSQ